MRAKALEMFLKLLDLRKARSAAIARRSHDDLSRAQSFEGQLREYHSEYQKSWVSAARQGGTADELAVRASFISRLGDTVDAQAPEVAAAAERFQRASVRAMADSTRSDLLQRFLRTRRDARRRLQERREEREANDRSGARRR